MDLVYIPELLSYGSLRSPQYRDYELPWNRDYFNYGNSTPVQCKRPSPQQEKSITKETCHLCRENKRRSLAAYIKGKSRQNSCHEIHEEEEDNGDAANSKKDTSNSDRKNPSDDTCK